MSIIRVSSKRKITVPEDVSRMAGLEVGDVLDVEVEHGKIVLTPKVSCGDTKSAALSLDEKELLVCALQKIDTINNDPLNSRGLDAEEIAVAV